MREKSQRSDERVDRPGWTESTEVDPRGTVVAIEEETGLFPNTVYLFVDRASRDLVGKAPANVRGGGRVPRLKLEVFEMRSEALLVILVREIFRVLYWIPSNAPVIRR
ncbi:hypothetical protein CRG98_016874 [Punica granatum]|uniref:Uncharacterized protein n=1 Tax=Punica granatum TaxID=22663 RepID=A0A2I0K4U1_PUNGR|nr:hypothetical protein CRG98_016874 [Punica granatum]